MHKLLNCFFTYNWIIFNKQITIERHLSRAQVIIVLVHSLIGLVGFFSFTFAVIIFLVIEKIYFPGTIVSHNITILFTSFIKLLNLLKNKPVDDHVVYLKLAYWTVFLFQFLSVFFVVLKKAHVIKYFFYKEPIHELFVI